MESLILLIAGKPALITWKVLFPMALLYLFFSYLKKPWESSKKQIVFALSLISLGMLIHQYSTFSKRGLILGKDEMTRESYVPRPPIPKNLITDPQSLLNKANEVLRKKSYPELLSLLTPESRLMLVPYTEKQVFSQLPREMVVEEPFPTPMGNDLTLFYGEKISGHVSSKKQKLILKKKSEYWYIDLKSSMNK